MTPGHYVARNLAAALLATSWSDDALLVAAQDYLEASMTIRPALVRLVAQVLAMASRPPTPACLVDIILRSPSFHDACKERLQSVQDLRPALTESKRAPEPAFSHLDVPRFATPGDLAAWLDLSVADLDWFADSQRRNRFADDPALMHYRWQFMAKSSGPPRLIEAPKPRLKAIQKRILREILDKLPPHDCAFGFVMGRSSLDAAALHCGEAVVIAADLRDFFPTVPLGRVHAIFASLGFPWAVARLLTGLTSVAAPPWVFDRLPAERRPIFASRQLFGRPHLPQGAPTSPALANLAAWRLDARLSGLARRFEARTTRYADDLTFSGGAQLARRSEKFLALVDRIVRDEGFALNPTKTRVTPASGLQQVMGVAVNRHVNLPRPAFDALKATLHNAARAGPASQNRAQHPDFQAHLEGRVGWAEQVNPARGAKLRRLLDRIEWPET